MLADLMNRHGLVTLDTGQRDRLPHQFARQDVIGILKKIGQLSALVTGR